MERVLMLMAVQGAMGAFDTLYHHEMTERLTWRRGARLELLIHGARNLLYAFLYLALAWGEWHGPWVWALVAVMTAEVALTLADFLIEDGSRDLPPSERVTHTLLAVNFGAVLALAAPLLWAWGALPAAVVPVGHGALSTVASLFGASVLLWGLRDLARVRALHRPAPLASPLAATLPQRQSILITGGTGLIGSRLAEVLGDAGHRVTVLTRDARRGRKFRGRVLLVESLELLRRDTAFDAVVNLAGAPIAGGPWTERRRRRLLASRIDTTRALVRWIAKAKRKPAVLVSGSAVGFYGTSDDEAFAEASGPGAGFAATLCAQWEAEALEAERFGVRVALLRTGIVLAAEGGILAQMLLPFELGLGATIGSGRQWLSWIHLDDLVGLILHAIAVETVRGALNATAPAPVQNRDFTRALAHALRRPAVLRVPATPLALALGDLARELLLAGQRVVPEKAEATGYAFLYPTLPEALREIVG